MAALMTTTIALKEWSAVIGALEAGRQRLLVRKGGIRDPRGVFELKHREFLLYPTIEHQEKQSIRPEFWGCFPADSADEAPRRVEFRVTAETALVREIRDPKILRKLENHHIWTPEFLEKRMSYRPQAPTVVVVVRCYRLPKPVLHVVRPEEAGCKSWVPLAEPVSVEGAEPVLDDRRFRAVLGEITAVLGD